MDVFNQTNCSCPEVVAAISAALDAHFAAGQCCCGCEEKAPVINVNPWSLKTRTLRNANDNRNPWIFKTHFQHNALTPGR